MHRNQTEWDAAVIGAGPAGSAAAAALAKKGFSVLLIDKEKFPRKKVCGACLNERSLAVLHQLGLDEAVNRENPVPLSRFQFAYRGREVRLPLQGGRALSRERFDSALAGEAQKAGAVFLDGTQAIVGDVSGEFREVSFPASVIRARIVITADGLGGSSLKKLKQFQTSAVSNSRFGTGLTIADAPSFYEPGVIYMAVDRGGYAGAVRLEDGRLNIAAALDAPGLKPAGMNRPAQVIAGIFERAGFSAIPELERAETRGTPVLTHQRNTIAAERLFVIGDSAGYAEPFTGEGMEWALAAAQEVLPCAAEGIQKWNPALVNRWKNRYQRRVRSRQVVCRMISLALRNKIILNFGMNYLSRKPQIASGLVSHLHGARA